MWMSFSKLASSDISTKGSITMADEDRESPISALILHLACSRADCIPVRKRNALISDVESSFKESSGRSILASLGCEYITSSQGKDGSSSILLTLHLTFSGIKCSSKYGYQRIARLYQVAITHEENKEARACLCKELCRSLRESGDATLLEEIKEKLPIEDMSDIFADMSNETAIPALAFSAPHWELFVKQALSDPVPSSRDMTLCRSLLKTMDFASWEKVVAPALLLKLKAKPETVLDMAEGLFRCVDADVLVQSSIVIEESISVLTKHAKSPKESVRNPAALILQHIARAAVESSKTVEATELLKKVTQAVADTKTLTQPYQRQTAYESLKKIGIMVGTQHVEMDPEVISTVLTGICTPLSKEAKTAVDSRERGIEAMLRWMVIAKRNGGSKGYEAALTFVRKPVIAKNGFDVLAILGGMVQILHPDIVESLVLDLWREVKFVEGLEGLIEAANKKHSSSSSIPQVEGLLAIYLCLINTVTSSSSKLPAIAEKALSAGSSKVEKTSFIYGDPLTNVVPVNPLVSQILPRIIAMYVKVTSTSGGTMVKTKASSAIIHALACAIANPSSTSDNNPAHSIGSTVQGMLDYQPDADALVEALFLHTNKLSLESSELKRSLNVTRQANDEIKDETVKGKCSSTGSYLGMDVNSVRHVARILVARQLEVRSLAMAMILMHVGSTLRTSGKQRTSLLSSTTRVLQDLAPDLVNNDNAFTVIADLIAEQASRAESNSDGALAIGDALQSGSLSLIISLGAIASNFSADTDDPEDEEMKPYVFARRLCTKEIAPRLAENVEFLVSQVESLSTLDIDIYKSDMGTLFREEPASASGADDTKVAGRSRRTEDEEWELQMKEELAKKKNSEDKAAVILTAADKKKIEKQDDRRRIISSTVTSFGRTFDAIQSLVVSDIEIGNACLPLLCESVLTLAVSDCPGARGISGMKEKSLGVLTSLAACVYEIQEEYASMMAMALVTSYRKVPSTLPGKQALKGMAISPLPSPCEPAAVTIFEMEEFQEELSGASFAFLFPVIRAALMGPRTTPGCEGALRVLERHTLLLAGEDKDPFVARLRSEMVASVLELLRHDRSQTFVDPTAYETLVACYSTDDEDSASGPVLSTAELAALLDERGALGSRSCRIASMIALGSIATNHRKLVKNNPLIENRIWLNCFDKNDSIRSEARKTWGIIHEVAGLEDLGQGSSLPPPSAMYSIPLLPLLTSEDKSIAQAAAAAFAAGMAAHSKSVNRNLEKLCTTYIESCPSPEDESKTSAKSLPEPSPAPAKKKPMGVPASLKKKTVKQSALEVASIGQPKRSKKKTTHNALLKPKAERTLDQASLESQFKTGSEKIPAEKDSPEKVASRLGVLGALASLPSANVTMDTETLSLLTSFLMAYGIADGDEEAKSASRNTLRDLIASYGGSDAAIAFLLPHLDEILKTGVANTDTLGGLSKEKMPHGTAASDRRKEGAVVALGSVALHLKGPANSGKIDTTIDMLLESLNTPNEGVQASVADCLTKLMKKGNTQERIESILDDLVMHCLSGDSTSTRRGAAYGISAAVKGSGIAALKKYSIVTRLEEACSSGSSTSKEGSLFAIELLCTRLGLLFEPYVIVLLPSLLKSFSDNSDHVRKAAAHAVGIIMSKLSAHGVKLVMPAVLTAFNDSAWRTKQASIHMLGSMSHLAPKQLASALPKVVPKLIEAFADTHPKVKGSAQEALNEISTVIRNPEISSISSVLLKALTDPADSTLSALEALIETEFLHAIDAPSLALIVPILHRGLRDRTATTKRYGALITGNICTMINDPRDFVPYLSTLMPDLKAILLDPIPDVRSIAAKAFGALTRGLGEGALADLRPWLVERLQAEDVSSAERSGAAQGLTEVLIASGSSVVESVLLEDILPLKSHPSACTRQGVLWMLTFLPPALGQNFAPFLDDCLPALISGLSDENEEVREIGMRAGRVLIRSHGRVHFGKILPILQNGMGDTDYRIRLSSLMLLGDLLSMIGGTTLLRTDGDTQDDIRKAEKAQAQLTLTLGVETRNRVLGDIYLARNDSFVDVRQTAVKVWKTVVSVTARTLRQILPVLVNRIVTDLASGDTEKTEVAGKCLGDIVSKLGDTVLPNIIPVLRNSLDEGDIFTRRGVCVGLSEVISSSTKDQILRFLDIIVKVVQDALCDDEEGVRQIAASSFQNLYTLVGSRAMDEVVPALIVSLESSDSDDIRRVRALNGLTGILSIRSRELLPYIIPRLTELPMTMNHAKALSSIAAVTGDTIYYHFKTIIPALMSDLANPPDDDKGREDEVRGCVRSICANSDEAGLNWLIGEFVSKCSSDKAATRRESCWMFEMVVTERKSLEQSCFGCCSLYEERKYTSIGPRDQMRLFYHEISV
jgi:HEAT repeat protein